MTWAQVPIPTTEDLENFVNADQLTAWDFVWAVLVIVIAVVLARLVRRGSRRILRRIPQTSKEASLLISRAAGWIVIVIGVIYSMTVLGIDMVPALMVILAVAIVVFFAGRRLMDNFSSGLVLQGSPMFYVGDQIVTPAGTGIVKEITGRTVVIESIDGETIHIPNKTVIDRPVVNLTNLGTRRSTLRVSVRYGTDLELARDVLERAAASCSTTHPDPPPEALISEFGENAVQIQLRFWHDPLILDEYRATDAVARAVATAIAERGIRIAFPQRTLWFGEGNDPRETSEG
jgi:small-conductance mechanosensitive channel